MSDNDIEKGGPGSGNWGHAGRPGSRGGSAPASSALSRRTGATRSIRQQIAKNPDRDVAVLGGGGGGRVAIETPYNREFVSDLKNNISPGMRKWNSDRKVWEVDEEAADAAMGIASQYFHVADGRSMNASQIKQVKDAVKTSRIKSSQRILRKNTDKIESEIADLDKQIGRFSFSSGSHRKAALVRKRAMFQYVLRDLKMKPENMEDIQIRGMAKAVEELGL